METLPADYQLNLSFLQIIISKLNGCPVTYEHHGITSAVDTIIASGSQNVPSSSQIVDTLNHIPAVEAHVLGRVIDAFVAQDLSAWCTMYVNLDALPGLTWLLKSKVVGSVSLTHVMLPDGTPHPLEMSLVSAPARPSCDIKFISKCALQTRAYKARLQVPVCNTRTNMEVDSAVAPALTAEQAMALILEKSPVAGKLIAAHFSAMQRSLEQTNEQRVSTKKQLEDAELALKAKHASANVDVALLRSQIHQLMENTPREAQLNCGLDNVDALSSELASDDPNKMLAATLRTVMCCNQSMMMARLKQQTPKTQSTPAISEDVPTAKRAKPEKALSNSDMLARALSATFEH